MVSEILQTPLEGLILIKPAVYHDKRGYFLETYQETDFIKLGISHKFVQDNQSMSDRGALRGLHFQNPPYAQAKLVRVISGAVLDVAVDIRKNSPTYGQSCMIELSGDNFLQLYLPEGFAHGFLTLEDRTIFSYKCSNSYHRDSESGLMWNDPALRIPWPTDNPLLSEKDRSFISFNMFVSPF